MGAIVYLIPLLSDMLPPCFQFSLLSSPGILQPLLHASQCCEEISSIGQYTYFRTPI